MLGWRTHTRTPEEIGGPEWCLINGRTHMWGLVGTWWAAIGCLGGWGADLLTGYLCWGGAEQPHRSQREGLRHGAAIGWLSSLGVSYLGVHRVAIAAPSSSEEAIWELINQRQIK